MMVIEYTMLPKYAMRPGLPVPEYVTDDNMNQVRVTWFKGGPQLSIDAMADRH